jgi:oligopeptide/dipeptide ABC transporter ATP-binding protein
MSRTNKTDRTNKGGQADSESRPSVGERSTDGPLLDVEDLQVRFDTAEETVHAVNGVNLHLDRNETLGIVGESGSGKSVTALSLLGLLEDAATVEGRVTFDGSNLLEKSEAKLEAIRGSRISMVFQDPGSSLNPVLKIGDQISETIRTHRAPSGENISWLEESVLGNLFRRKDSFTKFEESWQQTVELLDRVGIPVPDQRALEYPHEFSGGMKQRALIAIAISCQPDVLICDEPTTALDVTIEAQILELINELQREVGTAVLFITHDMGVIRKMCDRVAVMYAGNVIEQARTEALFEHAKHPYTNALLDSMPRLNQRSALDPIDGRVPDLTSEPTGCPFGPRCAYENDACNESFPPGYAAGPDASPVPIRHADDDVERVQTPPPQHAESDCVIEDDGHRAHCVLYGDTDYLTTTESVEGLPDEIRPARGGEDE